MKPTRRDFLKRLGLVAAAAAFWRPARAEPPPAATPAAGAAAPRPNILVILTDDVGWGDLRCYNPKSRIPCPNLDRLAREGMIFTHAHSTAANCAPSRYSLLTGNYPWRGRNPGGTWGAPYTETALAPGQQTVGNLLQAGGYRTALLGKTHFGGEFEIKDGKPDMSRPMTNGPKQWGFDYSYVLLCGHQVRPRVFIENNLATVAPKDLDAEFNERQWDPAQVGRKLLEKAAGFFDDHLARNKSEGTAKPFYMQLSTAGCHKPWVPAKDLQGTPLQGVTKMTEHTDMVYETDIVTGKLVEALEKRGLLANTLVVYTSDNGGIPEEINDWKHDSVGGLAGRKGTIAEGGHRVPFLLRWGDGTPAGSRIAPGTTRNQPVGNHDLVATAIELAGIAAPEDQALDSASLVPVLLGRRDDAAPVRRRLLAQAPGENTPQNGRKDIPSNGMYHALYDGDWKLVLNLKDQPAGLYNLAADPREQNNLLRAPAQAERVQRLEQAYRAIRASKRSVPESDPAAAPQG
jgi:arylsulfatase A-like enzyme